MIADFLTYLRTEKRYSELTVRAYGDDLRQFVLYSLRDKLPTAPAAKAPAEEWEEYHRHEEEVLQLFDPLLSDANDLRAWIIYLGRNEKRSATTINRKISSVKSFYRYLRKRGILHTDPFTQISAQKQPHRLPSFVEEGRMRRLAASLTSPSEDFQTERDALIILLFYATGIRLSELTGIRLSDFSSDFSQLKVRGKGDKERLVPIIEPVMAKIAHYLRLIKEQNICENDINSLILSQEGKPIGRSEVYRIVHRILREAGVQGKSSPHVLRHTFATHLLNCGADIRTIQELLGHTSLGATQIYTHNSIEQLKNIYNKAHPRAIKNIKEE